MADITMLTPSNYVNTYYTKLKDELGQYDLQINKLGFVGFLMNLLSWTQYDAKNYADNLFKEAFVGTSRNDTNLYLHASLYGYIPGFAKASTATGSLEFDFSLLPSLGSISKREIIFTGIEFVNNGIVFSTDAEYKFIQESIITGTTTTIVNGIPVIENTKVNRCYCVITDTSGNVKYIPSETETTVTAPFIGMYQQYKIESDEYIQSYDLGSFYPINFNLGTEFLADITASVTISGSTTVFEPYEIKRIKFLETSFNKSVFLTTNSSKDFTIECGSGIRGNYISNRTIKLKKTITSGAIGNINQSSSLSLNNPIVNSFQYDSNNKQTIIQYSNNNILKVNFDYSTGGSDPIDGDSLRNEIIHFIQSRDVLSTELDFYNIASKYLIDFEFNFNKTSLIQNIFYLNRVFRDKYQQVVKTFKYVHAIPNNLEFDYTLLNISDMELTDPLYNLDAGTYLYYFVYNDGFFDFNSDSLHTVNLTNPNNGIQINFTNINNSRIFIYFKNILSDNYIKYETYDNTFIFDGVNTGVEYITKSVETQMIFGIEYKIFDRIYVCPFTYKYDPFMDIYYGYLLNDNFIINIKSLTKLDINNTISSPSFHFNIVYDKGSKQTYIYIKSFQDISSFTFNLYIHGLNISNEPMEYIDTNTYKYTYNQLTDNSIIFEKIYLECDIFDAATSTKVFNCLTDQFYQIYPIQDIVKLVKFTADKSYILPIPLIDKETYLSNLEYYQNAILGFLFNTEFTQNRLISDDIFFSFLNSVNCYQPYLKYETLQNYNFDNITLPLKMNISCIIDKDYLKLNNVDLSSEKTNLIEEVAMKLQTEYTGIKIKYYNSQIIDFVHTDRPYIKKVDVIVTDDNNLEIPSGIDIRTKDEINQLMMEDSTYGNVIDRKVNLIKYVATFWRWDVNNIQITFIM